MSGYGYTFESEGTAALQPQEHPYLRLVTDVDLDDDLFVLQRDDCTAESASRPLVEPFDARKATRIFLAVLFSFSCLMGVMMYSDRISANHRSSLVEETPFEVVTVAQGDSLWDIAEVHGINGEDTAEVVRVIEQRNSLSSATLTPGQLLEVPATV